MIAHLRGKLLAKHPNQAIVETGGVGYDVTISVPTFSDLPGIGGDIALHIHTHVREDTIALYGFLRSEEKKLFEKLITVSGIGPKLAITILSGMAADEMVHDDARQPAPGGPAHGGPPQGQAPQVHRRVQAPDAAASRRVYGHRGVGSAAPTGGPVLLASDDVAPAVGGGQPRRSQPQEARAPRGPGLSDPIANFDASMARQKQVIGLMVRHEFLTQAQADEALLAPVALRRPLNSLT